MAEVALLDNRHEGVDISRIIWAGSETIFAATASVFVNDHDPVFPLPGCLDRTIDDTGRMVALIAQGGQEVARDIGVFPLFNNLHPRAENSQGNTIFRLAGNRTAMATDASPEIDHHGISFLTCVFLLHDTDP